MAYGTTLIACPSCSCHAFARESRCPSCGAPLRTLDGSIQRTAGAILLGLTVVAATSTGACGATVKSGSGTQSTSAGMGGNTGVGGNTGMGGMPSTSSFMNGLQSTSTYGTGPIGGFGGMGAVGGAGGQGTGTGSPDAG
jgi:hypothetical protein